MKKFNWKKYIYKIVVVVLIVFFVGGVGMGAANILSIEGTRELYTPEKPKTPFPETDAEVLEYVNAAINSALNAEVQPMVEMNESFSVDGDTFKNSAENDRINAAALLAEDGIESCIEDSFESKKADFGSSAGEFLSPLDISLSDIESVEIKYEYYKCSMCTTNVSPEDFAEECPECGNKNTLDKRYSDDYEIVIHVKPGSASFEKNAFPKSENISDIIGSAGNGYYKLGDFKKEDTKADITVRVNRLNDEIKALRFETDSLLSAKLGFDGAYKELGTVDCSVETGDRYEFSFVWPGISLDSHERTVEKGSTEVLKASLSCDDPVKYEVSWTSDNEDILTVDNEGYLKTHKKFGDANITASFEFNGKTYSDTCLVHVGVPAEGVDLSKGKLKMNTGDSFSLVAEFDPKDTTNTVCYWFTEDEKVAAIDENGKVTAVAPGSTVVYVVTDDGNYYSSCEVEVK